MSFLEKIFLLAEADETSREVVVELLELALYVLQDGP